MQALVDWVPIMFGTQVIKEKWPVRPVFPDYLSGSYDYDGKVIVVLENKTALLEMDQVHRFETYI